MRNFVPSTYHASDVSPPPWPVVKTLVGLHVVESTPLGQTGEERTYVVVAASFATSSTN